MNHIISPDTLQFLKDLKANNNREWFATNKENYLSARADIIALSESLRKKLNHHDDIEDTKVYRIYRDMRFSKDKTPYKDNMGIVFRRATAARRGGYYLQIEPGNSFIAGGFWAPNASDLRRIRVEIAANSCDFRHILSSKGFRKHFGELLGEKLKSAPRGFDKNHPDVDLLRYKQFLVKKDLTDREVLSADFVKNCDDTFRAMRPFFDLMSIILTTDENGVSLIE